jgi:hypothetical protein
MTAEDADRLAAWLDGLDARQLTLLWRWLTAYWARRMRAGGGR